jgi:tRNA-Thr(GGU) m(6)t(6)A37 methyltransferase TsaA
MRMAERSYEVRPIAYVESTLTDRENAPRQSDEDAPSARIVFQPGMAVGARDVQPGDELVLLTWLHKSERDVLAVFPRGDESRPITGVFSTRSPDRPNPIGLHTVIVDSVADEMIMVRHLEAIDGTPVLDIKPVLRARQER